MSNEALTIGIISDTHGLLREEALDFLSGCQCIVHAGDVGDSRILETLINLAPLTAVRGNIDTQPWASNLPVTATVKIADARVYVLHNLHDLDLDAQSADFNLVVSGHSHRPMQVSKAGVIYLNPGSAGPRRFRLPITVARVQLTTPDWKIIFIDLETGLALEI